MESKVCTKCEVKKPLSGFYTFGNLRPGKHRAECKECSDGRTRRWRITHPEKARENTRRSHKMQEKRKRNEL